MRTLVRFEYDIENVKLFDIVDGGAVHGAFNGNLTIYFDMSEDGKLLDESKQALRLEARRICRALKNRGMNATVSILNADTKAVYGRVFAEHPEIFTLLLWNHGRGNAPVEGTARAYAVRRIQGAGAYPHGHSFQRGVRGEAETWDAFPGFLPILTTHRTCVLTGQAILPAGRDLYPRAML